MPKHHQLSIGPTALANETHDEAVRPKCTQDADPDEMSAVLFDAALTNARDLCGNPKPITTAEVAFLLDISESLVRRMRSKDARERVSFAQMLRLPPSFHIALHREMNRRFGFGRQALLDVLDAVGVLAMAVER